MIVIDTKFLICLKCRRTTHGGASMKCWICGCEEATKSKAVGWNCSTDWTRENFEKYSKPNRYKRSYCEKCFEEHENKIKSEKELLVKLKKRMMFENAMQTLEKQKYDFYKNRDVINAVQEKLEEDPDKFDSSYEIVAAIIFVENEIYCKMQYKILNYQVDFLIPDYHLVLEIDGEQHKTNKGKDSVRDSEIKKELGKGWDILRIPTELLDMNASNLVKAIEEVLDYRETKKINWRKI